MAKRGTLATVTFGQGAAAIPMRQLLLLRHAKSSWDQPGLPDHARPLNEQGRRAAAAMRRAMQELGLTPDIVLVSSALRTRQTMLALEPWDETPLVEPMDALYNASVQQLLGVLATVAETARSVLLIGHNPGLHDLALLLSGTSAANALDPVARRLAQGYPSGSLTELAVASSWPLLRPGGGRLTRFLCPRDLPELAV